MRKISILSLHNLKKSKGQYISFGIMLCLTTFIMSIALVLAIQTPKAYDSRFEQLNTADINFLMPKLQDCNDLEDDILKIDGIRKLEKHEAVYLETTVKEFSGSDFTMNTVFYNLDSERKVNLLDISEKSSNVEVLELDEHPSCEEYKETIDIVKENAFRMEQLVLDLLTSYSSNTSLKKEPCDLREICEKSCKICSEVDQKDIIYKITGSQIVQGEPLLLERAIGNLISNAFRYNRLDGMVTVDIGENQLVVSDTGVGIPEEDLEKIFMPFYRVDTSRSRELGGSGLGLAIVKNILEAHGAKITVDSIVDEGTTFTVHFAMLSG